MAISPTSYQQQLQLDDTTAAESDTETSDPLKEQAAQHARAQRAAIVAGVDQAARGGGALGATPAGIDGITSMAGRGQQAVEAAMSQLAAAGGEMDAVTVQELTSKAKKYETISAMADKIHDSRQKSIERWLV